MLQTVWTWQPALYLFLGGMGAGAFVAAAVLYLAKPSEHKGIVCVSMWASVLCLGVGLLLLLTELTAPLRGLMLWQSFSHFTSWMTLGAWGLLAAVIVFALSALLATSSFRALPSRSGDAGSRRLEPVRKVLAVVGIGLGLFVAVYTGVLLMTAPGVPLWNTAFLPCLFTVSALDTGVALVELVGVALAKRDPLNVKARMVLEGAVILLVVFELAILVCFLGAYVLIAPQDAWTQAAKASADLLVTGILGPYFWIMVVALGLALPLVMALYALISHRRHEVRQDRLSTGGTLSVMMVVGAVGALIGGCELRFLILAAGTHADLVTSAIMSVIG